MSDKSSWTLNLIDRFTAPAQSAMKTVSDAVVSFSKRTGEAQAAGHTAFTGIGKDIAGVAVIAPVATQSINDLKKQIDGFRPLTGISETGRAIDIIGMKPIGVSKAFDKASLSVVDLRKEIARLPDHSNNLADSLGITKANHEVEGLEDHIKHLPGVKPQGLPIPQPTNLPGKQPSGLPGEQPPNLPGQQPPSVKKGFGERMQDSFYLTQNLQTVTSVFDTLTNKTAKYADALADVRKTSGLTAEQVDRLSGRLAKMNSRTGINDLLDISRIGGEMGIRDGKDLFEFTKATNYAQIALGDQFGSAENTARQLAKVSSLYGDTKDMKKSESITRVGSIVNELGNAGGIRGGNITDFMLRSGQLGSLGMKIDQTAGYGAVLERKGIDSQIGGSGMSTLMIAAIKNRALFAKQMKVSDKEMTRMIERNRDELLKTFLGSLTGKSNTQTISILGKLKLADNHEVLKTVMTLKENLTDLKDMQKITAKAFNEGNSVIKEAATKEDNLGGAIEKVKNRMEFLTVEFGKFIGAALPSITMVNSLAMTMVNIQPAMAILGSGLGSVKLKIKETAAASWGLMKSLAASGWNAAKAGVQFLWTATVGLGQFIVNLVRTSVALFGTTIQLLRQGVLLSTLKDKMVGAAIASWSFVKSQAAAGINALKAGANYIWTATVGLGSFVAGLVRAAAAQFALNIVMNANPIALFVLGVAAIGLAIWGIVKYWDKLKVYLIAFGKFILKMNPLTWMLQTFKKMFPETFASIVHFFGSIWDFITKWAQKAWGGIKWLWDKIKFFLGLGDSKMEVQVLGPPAAAKGDGDAEAKGAVPGGADLTSDKGKDTSSKVSASARSINMTLNITQNFHSIKDIDLNALKKKVTEIIVDAGRDAGVTLAGA